MANFLFSCFAFLLLLLHLRLCCIAQTPQVQVFLVPHSHCDAGYRLTAEGYFIDRVSHILDTVIEALELDPARKFVWEETIWLSYYWQVASDLKKDTLKTLIASGRFELIGGGWVMHDEADTSLYSTLNQMTTGLEFVTQTFGESARPWVGWHIDPFGHSSLSPYLYSSLGYSAFIINRIPDGEKQIRKETKTLEFLWNGQVDSTSPSFYNSSIFAHILDSHYSTPNFVGSTPEEQAQSFIDIIKFRAQWYNTSLVLIPFGNDFAFKDALKDFDSMDPVISAINNMSSSTGVTIRYSTLSDYFLALNQYPSVQFTMSSNNDFFPYIACSPCNSSVCSGFAVDTAPCGTEDAWWSGFYTSHPSQKHLSYLQDQILRNAEILNAIVQLNGNLDFAEKTFATSFKDEEDGLKTTPEALSLGRNTSGLLQHHDAITGTSFDYCTESVNHCDCFTDYNLKLNSSLSSLDQFVANQKGILLSELPDPVSNPAPLFPNSNTLLLLKQLNSSFPWLPVVLSNSLAWDREEIVSIPVPRCVTTAQDDLELESCPNYSVYNSLGDPVLSQLVEDPVMESRDLYIAIKVPALGMETCFVHFEGNTLRRKLAPHFKTQVTPISSLAPFNLSNGAAALGFDVNGRLQFVQIPCNESNGFAELFMIPPNSSFCILPVTEDFVHYFERHPESVNIFTGTNVYDFVPRSPESETSLWALDVSQPYYIAADSGPLVWQTSVQITPYCSRAFRLFNPDYVSSSLLQANMFSLLHAPTKVGPLPASLGSGTVALRLISSFASTNQFTTFSNLFQHRVRTYNSSLPVQGNVYPLVGGLFAELDASSLSFGLIPLRPVGGYANGSLMEIQVHRYIEDLDFRGLDFTTIAEDLPILIGPASLYASTQAIVAHLFFYPLAVHPGPTLASLSSWTSSFKTTISPLGENPFANGLHLLGLRGRTDGSLGIWLQGLPSFSSGSLVPQTFLNLTTDSLETTADFALPIDLARKERLSWNTSDESVRPSFINAPESNSNRDNGMPSLISVEPTTYRAFLVAQNQKNSR